jgi:nucleoside-diphosphate-sugar epimerase
MNSHKVLVTGGSGFIGIHLVELLRQRNYTVLNLDIKKPIDNKNLDLWTNVSLLEKDSLGKYVAKFNPNYIVHLGATTTQDAKSLDDFEVNIKGTQNILDTSSMLTNLKKFVFTSTQYVNSPGYAISEILDELKPYGFYGDSKLLGEKMTADLLQDSSWTIIRPTTIWGPWHPILAKGLWKQILKARYFHPKSDTAVKAYGYVKNSAWQIVSLMEMDNSLTDKKVFYIGDENISQDKWVSAFVFRLTNRKMRRIHKLNLFMLSEIGELLNRLGIKFPMYRSRYRNLITSNPSPLDNILMLLGPPPILFEEAVDETCAWLEEINNLRNSEH